MNISDNTLIRLDSMSHDAVNSANNCNIYGALFILSEFMKTVQDITRGGSSEDFVKLTNMGMNTITNIGNAFKNNCGCKGIITAVEYKKSQQL